MTSSMIWIVMIAVMVLSMIIQARLKSRFEKYSEVPTGLSGAEVAQRMLQAHGIHDVNIVSMVPVLTFTNSWISWVLLAGLIFYQAFPSLLWIAIAMFGLTTLFSFITLPVEVNASARAVQWLDNAGVVSYETKPMAQDALKWAAYTYVIAAIGSLATLLYYISIARRR